MYDSAFTSKCKNAWMTEYMDFIESLNLTNRCRAMKNLKTALSTQAIFETVRNDTVQMQRLKSIDKNTNKLLELRLKRLTRTILKHVYKPRGRMFCRSMKAAMVAFPNK